MRPPDISRRVSTLRSLITFFFLPLVDGITPLLFNHFPRLLNMLKFGMHPTHSKPDARNTIPIAALQGSLCQKHILSCV